MMRHRSWLAGLASKIFPRRFAVAKRAARRRPQASLRSFSDAPLATETLEPRHLLSGVSLVSVDTLEQGNEADGSAPSIGFVSNSAFTTTTTETLPTLSIETTQQGSEIDGLPTIFEVSRTGGLNESLNFWILFRGTARPNVDYQAPENLTDYPPDFYNIANVQIGQGFDSAEIVLPTIIDTEVDPYETVTAILWPQNYYSVKPTEDRATATITAEGVSVEAGSQLTETYNSWGAMGETRRNDGAFAALDQDGRITAWGNLAYGGTGAPSGTGYEQITSSQRAFAALHANGSISTWGDQDYGGSGGPSGTGYTEIFSTDYAFAALKNDGSIHCWGTRIYSTPNGYGYTSITTNDESFAALHSNGGIVAWGSGSGAYGAPSDDGYVEIVANDGAFAARKSDGTLTSWGNQSYGGDYLDNSLAPGGDGYVRIVASERAFAAIKADGTLTAWGDHEHGGSLVPNANGYEQITSSQRAFAALHANGSISTWGDQDYGGSGGPSGTGYTEIFSTDYAFAALKNDGSIHCWGTRIYSTPNGYGYTSITTNDESFAALHSNGGIVAWGSGSGAYGAPSDDGYVEIVANDGAFAARKSDGTLTSWGNQSYGGDYLDNSLAPGGNGFTQIFSNERAFAARKADGSITCWGDVNYGGTGGNSGTGNTEVVSTLSAFASLKNNGSITSWGNINAGGSGSPVGNGFTEICATNFAFSALKNDGTIVSWGDGANGGSGAPTDAGYVKIYATNGAFAAIKADGSITCWGATDYGGSGGPSDNGYVEIVSNDSVFAARKGNGSITSWGNSNFGGGLTSAGTGYTSICASPGAFAALTADGGIQTWGSWDYGAALTPPSPEYTQLVANQVAFSAVTVWGEVFSWGGQQADGWNGISPTAICLEISSNIGAFSGLLNDGSTYTWGYVDYIAGGPVDTGYTKIYSSPKAFTGIKDDGSLTSWGYGENGGANAPIDSGYVAVFSNTNAFSALKSDGSLTSWGHSSYGGSGAPNGSDFVAFASPLANDVLNTYPSFVDQSLSVAENSPADTVVGTLVGTDPQGQSLTFTIPTNIDPNGNGTAAFRIDNDQLLVQDAADLDFESNGSLVITARASDGTFSTTALVTVFLSDINETPQILSPASLSADENTTAVTNVAVGDPDAGDTIGYAISGGVDASLFDIDPVSGALSFISAPDFETPLSSAGSNLYVVEITATDSGGLADQKSFSISVSDVNESPVMDDALMAIVENQVDGTVVGTLVGADVDGDTLTYSITANVDPDGDGNDAFRIEGDQLLVNDTGDFDYETNPQLVITTQVSDGNLTDSAQITVEVNNSDDPPIITLLGDSPYLLEASNTASYSDPGATAVDPEDGDITGSVSVSGQVVNLSVPGSYLINYDVQDSAGNDAETVTRTVVVQDTLAPVITLSGSDTTLIEAGFPYSDASATASDSLDGDVSGSVVVSGAVDPATPGTYVLTYNVQDAAGNAADPVTRTVTVQDTLRPIIALNYSGEVLQVSDQSDTGLGGEVNAPSGVPTETSLSVVGDTGRLATPIIRATPFTQPDGTPVTSRQEWSGVVSAGAVSEIPAAAVWDHVDTLTPTTSFVLIDQDGTSQETTVEAIDWDTRSTYLFQYDAVDNSGNYAEQVVFALILNDQVAPVINVTGGASETVEAASDWTLTEAAATDNIDGELTANILYSVENVTASTTLGTDLTYVEAAALLDTTQVGNYLVTMQVSDAAGIYGDNNTDNAATAYKAISIQDTLAPVITLTGDAETNAEAGFSFNDPGATAIDLLDGDLTSSIVVSGDGVDTNTLGTYTLAYGVQDATGNVAQGVTRTVTVQDTLAPVITLSGDAAPYIEMGTTYTDPGVSATDAFEGDLSSNVVVSGDAVDTSAIGAYTVVYDVSDSSGNVAQTVSRTVTVTPPNTPPVVNDQSFSVAENSAEGTSVGFILASDTEGHPLSYSIATNTDPNANGFDAFRLEGNELIVADPSDFDHETAAALTLTVAVTDIALTTNATITVNVTNVNEAPGNTVPGNQTVNEDTNLTFSGANAISVGDVDAGSADVQVALSVSSGTLTLSGTAGLTFAVGANGTAAMTITGPTNAINAALEGMIYRGDLDFNGTDVLTIETNDLGNTGSGGPLSSGPDTVTITVTPVNDAPVISEQTFTVPENSIAGTVVGTLAATDVDGNETYSQLSFYTDFENGLPAAFSGVDNNLESVAGYAQLGGFSGNFLHNYKDPAVVNAPMTATIATFTALPPHTHVNLGFLLASIDTRETNYSSYPGDSFNVAIDGTVIFSEIFSNDAGDAMYQPPPGVLLGSNDYGWYSSLDSGFDMGLDPTFAQIPHTSSTLEISWYQSHASGWWGWAGDNQTWAIDNVAISTGGFPISFALESQTDLDGDGNDAFRIEGDQLIVNDPDDLDFEGTNPLVVNVSASDGLDSSSADVTVNLTDVPDTPGTISGTFWHDLDEDGTRDGNEPALSGWTAYIDANLSGTFDAGEVSTLSDASGNYTFTGVDAGTYVIGQVLQSNWSQTYPGSTGSSTSSMRAMESSHSRPAIRSNGEIIEDTPFTDNEVIVKLAEGLTPGALSELRTLQASRGAATITTTQTLGVELWSVTEDVASAVAIWADDARLEYVQPNYLVEATLGEPDDTSYDQLWGLHNTGQTGGTVDADIDAPEAWDIQTGTDIVVGIIDSGIDYSHPDLVDNIWTNPGEIANNGLDDDDNGYIDDVYGYDFVYEDSDPNDALGHGTHVAGTVAANGDNGVGVVGVSWSAKIVPIKIFSTNGAVATNMNVVRAIEYATIIGARITNNSYNWPESQSIYDAISAAQDAGVLFVTSAGNNGDDNDVVDHFPSDYELDNIISVAATDHNDQLTVFSSGKTSNFGATTVHLGAPGKDVYSTTLSGSYSSYSGTSMAAPHVTGVAALILSENPTLSAAEVKQIILDSVDPIPALDGITITGGRLNAHSALLLAQASRTSHTVALEWTEDVTGIDFGNRVGDEITLDDQSITVAENTAEQTVVATLSGTVASFALTIDNSDAGFTSTSEFVYLNNPNKTAEAYNGDNHFAQIETTGQATWTFNSLPSGEYRVASTWSHQYNNNYNAIDAPFTILDGATPVGSATINQRITPDDFTAEGYGWETLDEVVVTSGSLVVNLGVGSANPNNSTVADAIRIERIGPAAALTYSVLTGVDPDGDGSDAFRIEDDQIVVNDSGDLDYEASSQLIFTVQVSDGTLTDSAQITVDLTDVNERPVIAAPNDQSHTEGDEVSLALVASDPENDPLTWTATDLPPGLLIDDSTGAITGTLASDSSGSYATEISVTDGSLTDTVLFSWSVVEGDDPPVITLIGASQLTVEASSTGSYSDPGATAIDEEDGDLSGSILVSGQLVNLAVIGTYVLNYDVQDSFGNDAETVSRTVLVQDTLAPVITLSGSDTTLIEAGFPYTDAGATASDSLDGDVSGSIVVSGDVVDVATTGSYTVLYNVQDAAGNAADQVTRTVTVQDTLRPVISMTYSGEVLQVSDHAGTGLGGEANSPAGLPSETELNAVGSAGRLQTPIIRSTDFTQPDGSPVQSRQEWTAIEPAGSVSEIPVAAAWDHGDSSIVPSSTIVIIDRDGTPLDETVGAVDFDTRSTYLFEYDAVDDSGNYAEQVVFALILDDQAAPTITVVGGTQEMVEAASGWTLSEATATDNIDGSLTASILYSVENVSTSTTLGTDLTYAEAAALLDTTQVGNYLITIQVSDAAGIYGLNNSNNLATATKAVAIQDTLKPVITLTGDSMINLPQTIGGTYSDPGATAVDSLDGDLSGSVVVGGDVVDLEQDGAYVITYNVQDNAGNVAEQVTRTVNVIPIVVEDVVILDDGEAGFAQSGFTEQSNAQVAAAYDSDVHHMQGGTGEASWTFTGLPADRYQVAATWAYKYNNNYNATDAPFTLSDGAGGVFSTQIVNQKLTPGEFEDAGVMWDTLDTVDVSGGTLVVTLGAGSAANKYVVADAIRVSVAATLTLSINDASVAESAGAAATTATVTRNGPTDYPVDVDLLVSDATEISVPATVTIPAGQASVAFSIDAVDDVFFDGSQNVNVLATAIGYSDGSDSLEILDDETAHTALIDDGEAGFAQSGFTYQSNAQVAAAYNGDNYNLRNGDDADQASWTFTGLDDGAYHVMATWAHKYNNNYNATDAPFQILDADSNVLSSVAINQKNAPSQHDVGGYFWDTLDTVYVAGGQLTVTVGATTVANKFVVADAVRIEQLVQSSPTLVVQLGEEIVSENAGAVAGLVSRGAETTGELVVSLASDDPATGTVPTTVTIADGAGSASFMLAVVDDAVVDGDQNVIITASAAGYAGGSDSLLVEDDEFPPVQIMDDGDAGFSTSGGFKDRSWATAYGGDNHNMRGGDGEARWRFTDLIDGEYTVSVTWDHISSNVYNATDAPFTIRNAAYEQLLAAAVDQTLSPADFSDGVTDWHTLGTVYVIDGELTVSLTETLVNKYVVADAVRLEIDTNPSPKLLVILDDSSVSEAGTVNGKVIRTGDTAGSLTVNLASDNADAATVPDTITLGEGARYGTFTITPTDDSAPDGIQVTNIGASAEGFAAGTAALDVVDDDATILFVDNGEDGFVADAGFKRRNVVGAYQNDNHYMRGGTGEASWTFTGLEEGQYFVSTTWNHIWDNRYNTERAPFSIRNGSGNLLSTLIVDQTQTPADFTDGGYGWKGLAPVYINDGTLVVTLGASPTNHHAVADAIRIELNESLAPSLFVLVDSESESAGSATGTVVRTGDTSSEAVVGLTSSNHAAATVQSSITFAIGESTKSFTITPTDDSSPDGIQQSTVEATATGYAAGTAVLNVEDDDALSVAIMDNTDSGFTSNGFRYNANKQVSQAYGGNNESLKGGEPGEEASWTFTGLTDGVYHVSATWNHQYDNNYNATDAQYSITNAADEALATTTINQSNAPSEFLDNGIAWGTLDTVTVTGGELIVTVSGGSNQNRHTVADAVRIARVAELGGSSMQSAEADPFYDPLEDALDDLAGEWGETSADEESLLWGE